MKNYSKNNKDNFKKNYWGLVLVKKNMKKISIIVAGLLYFGTNAQNTFPPSGNVGVGTAAPTFPLEVYASGVFNNGIKITQPGAQGPSALWLNSLPSGGREWTLYSLGIADFPLPGNFVIADNSSGGGNRMFIYGASLASGNKAGFVGINNITPGNRLEITQPPAVFATGESGLRFTNLTSLKTPQSNPGPGVLALNATGDVIYVPTPSACCLGNLCTAFNSNPLPGDYQIPLNAFKFNFTPATTSAPANRSSQVNIGFPTCATGAGRLNVETNIHHFAGDFINNNGFAAGFQCVGVGGRATSTNTNAVGVRGQAMSAPLANAAIGVDGGSNDPASTAGFNIGVNGKASNGVNESVGGFFQVIPGTSASPRNAGVRGDALVTNATSIDMGGIFTSTVGGTKVFGAIGGINRTASVNTNAGIAALSAGISVGVYGYNPGGVQGTPTFNQWAGYFDGSVKINGQALCTASAWTSDRRFKKDIKGLENIREKLIRIKGYSYQYNTSDFKDRNFPQGTQIGFIAQELKEVFPELVIEDAQGYNYVNYMGMIPVLLEAIKDQQKQIENQASTNGDIQKQLDDQKKINGALQSKMDKLEQMINSCCSGGSSNSKAIGQPVNLSDKNVIVLNQNVPNPFAESTVITYNIPVDFKKAQINFTTTDGKIIRTVDITSKGEGRLNVFANDLTNGLYTYTLIVDGKVIDTRKMVKD